ncbi:cytochrome P450 [Lentzea sp. NBRC 105346]|uniref:cytochrome P450 n=1 Tax=Lentzea sp. NBRC 105346 TaxID=3032205 RepID=UPI0024A1A5E4|nr:cytochrome P450 [Lentzea sp. NBRC 105346]GLZ27983.1 cytochrome P450 [Lentzea sp. NBRC 105346]
MTRAYPFGPQHRLDVDPLFAELRSSEPVTRVRMPHGGDAWLVTTYAEAKAVFGDDRRFGRAMTVGADVPRARPVIQASRSIHTMDPPEHTSLRRMVSKAFTVRRVAELESRTQRIVDDLLDRMTTPADLVKELAEPLPITVICELLGVPYADREEFHAWSDAAVALTAYTPDQVLDARINLVTYLCRLTEQRREHPSDDLLTGLVQAGGHLSEFEIASFGVALLVAGHATTVNQIGNFTCVLLEHPGELARLRADPSLLPTAIEELLRFTPLAAVAEFPQMALADLELGGVHIKAGDTVLVELASVNRDPKVFTDPDVLDLGRTPNPHLAFAHGAHHCLGAQLARMELRVAIGSLVRRFPALRLAVPPDQLEFIDGQLIRGLRSLPVSW